MTATEYVILVDDQDREIGTSEKLAAHQQCLLHRAFSVFIFCNDRQLLLQQRAAIKYHSPGLWTNTCCSHPRQGETIQDAAKRRLVEEFGFSAPLSELGWFHYTAHFSNGLSENEIDHVLVGTIQDENLINPNPDEIQAYRWVDIDQLAAEIEANPERFTPWLAEALALVRKHSW